MNERQLFRALGDVDDSLLEAAERLPHRKKPRHTGLWIAACLCLAASALATVGLTANVTPLLHLPSKLIIIAFMYFGRVGILTISLGFLMGDRAVERFRYAETKLLIG